jgi:hypothetical protein
MIYNRHPHRSPVSALFAAGILGGLSIISEYHQGLPQDLMQNLMMDSIDDRYTGNIVRFLDRIGKSQESDERSGYPQSSSC